MWGDTVVMVVIVRATGTPLEADCSIGAPRPGHQAHGSHVGDPGRSWPGLERPGGGGPELPRPRSGLSGWRAGTADCDVTRLAHQSEDSTCRGQKATALRSSVRAI